MVIGCSPVAGTNKDEIARQGETPCLDVFHNDVSALAHAIVEAQHARIGFDRGGPTGHRKLWSKVRFSITAICRVS